MSREEAVVTAAQERAAALAAGDAPRLTALLHESYHWTTHTGETYTRDEYVSCNTGGTTVWHDQSLGETHVEVVDRTAVLRTEVVDVVRGPDGRPETFRMPVTQVWVDEVGGWRCLAGHAGPRRP